MGLEMDLALVEKGLRANFQRDLAAIATAWEKITMLVPSDSDQEKQEWLGDVPQMQEWTDEKKPGGLLEHTYTLVNKDYERTIKVNRRLFRRDKTAQLNRIQGRLSARAGQWPIKMAMTTLKNGATTLCHDGQFFHDNDHESGDSGSQTNIVAGTGTTLATARADLKSAKILMRGFKGDTGELWFGDNLDLVLTCGPNMEDVLMQLLNAQMVPDASTGGNTNIYRGAADLIVSGEITDDKWFVNEVGGGTKPVVFQHEIWPAQLAILGAREPGGTHSDSSFFRKEYLMGVEAAGAWGYGHWQQSVLINQ